MFFHVWTAEGSWTKLLRWIATAVRCAPFRCSFFFRFGVSQLHVLFVWNKNWWRRTENHKDGFSGARGDGGPKYELFVIVWCLSTVLTCFLLSFELLFPFVYFRGKRIHDSTFRDIIWHSVGDSWAPWGSSGVKQRQFLTCSQTFFWHVFGRCGIDPIVTWDHLKKGNFRKYMFVSFSEIQILLKN